METTGPLRILESGLDDPAVQALLKLHWEELRANSPPESAHVLDLSSLRSPDIRFWSVWDGETLLGVGALRRLSDTEGEVKSMRTAATARRRGVARALLRAIVAAARQSGLRRLSLETGASHHFDAAVSLYGAEGFTPCPPFGAYRPDPNSLFMTMALPEG